MTRVGRSKTRTEKIEDDKTLMFTFGKRLPSFVKKAYEMGILTGVDVALLVVSPSGKLTPFSINSRIEDIIAKFLNLPDDKRGIRIENQGHLLETLERIKHDDNDALVRQQMASSSGSSSDMQAAITELENKRDVLRQHLSNFSCDNDAPMIAESFQLRQERILTALTQVRERKQQLHLQQQPPTQQELPFDYLQNNYENMPNMQQTPIQITPESQQPQFNIPMNQELPFDFHQNNKNMPNMLQTPFQTTPETQQPVFNAPTQQELPSNFHQNNNNMPNMLQTPIQTTPETQQPLFNAPTQQELPFDFHQNNKNMPNMLQAPFDQTLFDAPITQESLFDFLQDNYGDMPMLQAPFDQTALGTQQDCTTNDDDELFAVVERFCSCGRSLFSSQVAEQQNQNPDAAFQPSAAASGSNGGSFSGQAAEQQNPNCLPYNLDQSDHNHQSSLVQECITSAPPKQECINNSSIANDLIPSHSLQQDYGEQNTDLDQEDPCDLYLTFTEDDDIIIDSYTAQDSAQPLPHRP